MKITGEIPHPFINKPKSNWEKREAWNRSASLWSLRENWGRNLREFGGILWEWDIQAKLSE